MTEAVRLAQDALLTLSLYLRHSGFNMVAKRMGLVARVHHDSIHYWQRTSNTHTVDEQ